MQNGFVETFGRLRDECLNEHLFANLNEARQIIEEWRIDYNTNRPRRRTSIGRRCQSAFKICRPNDNLSFVTLDDQRVHPVNQPPLGEISDAKLLHAKALVLDRSY
jgi:hypothetical protein